MNTRRISELVSSRMPNPVWVAYEPILNQLFEPSEPRLQSVEELASFYTPARLVTYPSAVVTRAVGRARDVCPDIDVESIGHAEAEIICWLATSKQHLVLYIIGPRGTGKTSLTNYVFRVLPTKVASLQKLSPLILDLREQPDLPTEQGLFDAVRESVSEKLSELAVSHPRVQIDEFDYLRPGCNSPLSQRMSNPGTLRSLTLDCLRMWIKVARSVGQEPIVVFDNCDKVQARSIGHVLSLSRALALRDHTRTIVCLRPFAFRAQVEHASHLNGFFAYSLAVHPPDLVAVLKNRLTALKGEQPELWDRCSKQMLHLPLHPQIQVQIGDIGSAMERCLKYFMDHDFQKFIIGKLANNDVRMALRAVRCFFRSRSLPARAFFQPSLARNIQTIEDLHADSQNYSDRIRVYDILNGIMIDDRSYYQDQLVHGNAVVTNLFDLGLGDSPCSLLQPRILSLFESTGPDTSGDYVRASLTDLGYERESIRLALDRLLSRGLLQSPQHDEDYRQVHSASLTETGAFYLHRLLRDQDYLLNVVYDVRLPHREWRNNPSDDFIPRCESLLELISVLLQAEQSECEHLTERLGSVSPRLIQSCGSIAEIVFNAVIEALSGAHLKARSEGVRKHAQQMLQRIDGGLRTEVAETSKRFADLRSHWSRLASVIEQDFQIEGGGVAKVRMPDYLEVGQAGIVELTIDDLDVRGHGIDAFLDIPGTELVDVVTPFFRIPRINGKRSARWNIRCTAKRARSLPGEILLTDGGEPIVALEVGQRSRVDE